MTTTSSEDIVIYLSERILQHALAAYAVQNFTHRVFPYPEIGATLLGGELNLTLGNGGAEVHLEIHAIFEWRLGGKREGRGGIALPPKRETFRLRLSANFAVSQGELYIQIAEGRVRVAGGGLVEKAANEAVQLLIRQVFSQPLIRLPIQFDVSTPGGESTDESRLTLAGVDIRPGALRVALQLSHDTITPPSGFPLPDEAARRSRGKAIALIQRGIAARNAGRLDLAAALFCRAALQADPSFAVAWVWLSTAVKTGSERRFCLERALAIDPAYNSVADTLGNLSHVPAICPRISDYPLAL